MLDAGGGGGGGTPWGALTVDEMYRLIKSADPDKQWAIADGWKKSAELISSHRFQVEGYRDNLAAAWPPKGSEASTAYLDRLDLLIASLTETYEAALQNYDAVVSATGSIYQAQVQMDKLYQEYKNNETLLANFAAKQQEQQNNPTPTPSPSPSGGEQPPVAAGRQEALRLQASTMLSGVSTDLAQAQVRIARPTKYEPGGTKDKDSQAATESYVPPPIPPITPNYGDNTTSSTSSARPPTTAVTNIPTPVAPLPTTTQPGLVLGGTPTPVLTPPAAPVSPLPGLPSGTGGPVPGPGILPPGTTLVPGTNGQPTSTIGRGIGTPRDGLLRPGAHAPEGLRAMPPGGLIGGTPAVGLGQPASGRAGVNRVNPVGGVIGANGTGHNPGHQGIRASDHASGIHGQGAGRRAGQRDQVGDTHWDPDNPWETAQGVEPVVMPPREQKVDPGPAIGLS